MTLHLPLSRSALLLALGLPAMAHAQVSYEKTTRAELFSIDGMAVVAQTKQSSGRSLLVSNAVLVETNGADMLLQVFNARGDVLHDLVIGNADYHDVCKEVAQVNGAYYLAGYTRSIDTSEAHTFTAFIIKVDTALNFIWQKNYILLGEELYANAITPTADGHLLVAGQVYDGSEFQTFVMKTDMQGDPLWIDQYTMEHGEKFQCIRELPSGEIMLSGSVVFGFELVLPITLKLNAAGTPVWGRYFNYPPVSVVERSDLSFIKSVSNTELLLAGNTDVMGAGGEDFYMIRIDTSGTVVHAHTYGGDQFDQPYGINYDAQTNLLVMQGNSASFDPQFQTRALSMHVRPDGTLAGAMLYGDTALHQPVILYHFTRMDNNSVQLAGSRPSPAEDIYLTGANNAGANTCHTYAASPAVQTVTTGTGTYAVDVTALTPDVNDLALHVYHFANDTFLCAPPPITEGIDERAAGALRLYPDPGDGRFTLELPAGLHPVQIEVRDALGRSVYTARYTAKTLDLGDCLSKGEYLVIVRDANGGRLVQRYLRQ